MHITLCPSHHAGSSVIDTRVAPSPELPLALVGNDMRTQLYRHICTYIHTVAIGKKGWTYLNIKELHKITVINFNTGKVVPVRTIY
jgi:hypothetical protein